LKGKNNLEIVEVIRKSWLNFEAFTMYYY